MAALRGYRGNARRGCRVARLILAVFDALRSFDRPCTRSEIEREALLTRDEVRIGIDGLRRRHAVRMEGLPRQQATYRLVPGAERPEDRRGHYDRSEEIRERHALAHVKHRAAMPRGGASVVPAGQHQYSPAMGPSSDVMVGARRQVKGGMSLGGSNNTIPSCELAQIWRLPDLSNGSDDAE